MKRALAWIATAVLPPLLLFAVLAFAWDWIVRVRDVPPFVFPSPGAVWRAAADNRDALARAVWLTFQAAAAGFFLSIAAGALAAFAFAQSRWIERAAYPYAIFFQTVPIVAIAPLIVRWLGSGFESVAATAFIVGVFPIVSNGTAGLTHLDPAQEELFDINDAGRLQRLFLLRLPRSLPYFIAGAKTSSGLCVIGAIVGEFFAGYGRDEYGLGYLIYMTNNQLKIDYMFAAVICATAMGVAIFTVVSAAGDAAAARMRE